MQRFLLLLALILPLGAAPSLKVNGTEATFTRGTSAFAPDDVIDEFTVTGNFGDSVTATSVAGITGPASQPSDPVLLLDPAGDRDGDGQSNQFEDTTSTSPLDASSRFEAQQTATTLSFPVAPGRTFHYQTSTDLVSWSDPLPAPKNGVIILQNDGTRLFVRILATKD